MKRLLFSIPLHIAALAACGQGMLNFENYVPAVLIDAPITNTAAARIVGPGPFVADLFWSSSTTTPTDNLVALGLNRQFMSQGIGPGYFAGTTATLPLPGATTILAQVRAWDTTFGATYAQARDNGGEFGYSNPILVTLTLPLNAPANLIGLQGFQLQVIPEPSSLALAVVAGGVFLLRFRKRAARTKMSPEP